MTKRLTLAYKQRHDISLLSALITTWLKGNLGQAVNERGHSAPSCVVTKQRLNQAVN